MRIHIFDTYAQTADNRVLHFDVLVADEFGAEYARRCALHWLESIGEQTTQIELKSCQYCHSEAANQEMERHVTKTGYGIIQMAGCPAAAKPSIGVTK